MDILKGNEKRRASCKAIGSEKKRMGHVREDAFGALFCDPSVTTYKAEADKTITNRDLLIRLDGAIGPLRSGATSIKSGNNLQFTLGRIPELMEALDKINVIRQRSLWEKYLAKGHSANPAAILTYKTDAGWIFFNMDHVIDFIVNNAEWRELPSGRIKGDFTDTSKAGKSQYLTYEYRATHGSHFLGANGNKGKPFIRLLMANIKHLVVDTQ